MSQADPAMVRPSLSPLPPTLPYGKPLAGLEQAGGQNLAQPHRTLGHSQASFLMSVVVTEAQVVRCSSSNTLVGPNGSPQISCPVPQDRRQECKDGESQRATRLIPEAASGPPISASSGAPGQPKRCPAGTGWPTQSFLATRTQSCCPTIP